MFESAYTSAVNLHRWVVLSPDVLEWVTELGGKKTQAWIVGQAEPKMFKQYQKLPTVGPFHRPSLEAILALRPTRVFVTKNGNPAAIVEKLRSSKVSVEVLDTRSLKGLGSSIKRLSQLMEVESEGQIWIQRLNTVRERKKKKNRSCVLIVGVAPLVVASRKTFLGEIFDSLGCRIFPEAVSSAYPIIQREALLSLSNTEWFVFGHMLPQEGLLELKNDAHRAKAKMVELNQSEILRPSPWLIKKASEDATSFF